MTLEDRDITVRLAEIAEVLEVSVRTIANYVKKGMPFIQNGKEKMYKVKECLAWAYSNGCLLLELETSVDIDVEELSPSIRKDLADARIKELKLSQMKEEVIEKSIVIQDATSVGIALRDNLMSIPSRIGNILAVETEPREIIEVLTKELRQSLEDISSEFME